MHRQLLYIIEVNQSTSKIILLFKKLIYGYGESIGRVVQIAITIASG